MIASMASVISTSTVSATHTQSATIDISLLPNSTAKVLTITVTNNGPDAIDNVRIVLPTGFTTPAATAVVLADDNEVTLGGVDNENVVIPAGTKLVITGNTTITLPENIELIRKVDENIRVENAAGTAGENRVLLENVRIKKPLATNMTGLVANDNVKLADAQTVALQEGDVVMVSEAIVLRKTGDNFELVSDATVKVHDDVNVTGLSSVDNIELIDALTGRVENAEHWITTHAVNTKVGIDTYSLAAGAWITIMRASGESGENRVVLPAGSIVNLAANTTVKLLENTQVTRKSGENVVTTHVENRPINWAQDNVAVNTIEWVGIGDNQIASGASLSFPLYATSPASTGDYSIFVRATDTAGNLMVTEIIVKVDATAPTVTAQMTPSWVKGNTVVTVKVIASEKLAKLDNVMVAENNGENVWIEMVSSDMTNWYGSYTTGDNWQRDGEAVVFVIGADFEDEAGNAGTDYDNKFNIDRSAPSKPNLAGLSSWITENSIKTPKAGLQTKTATWLIEGYAKDNFLGWLAPREGMTVKVRVGTTVYTFTPSASGYFYQSITLAQGMQEVGIQYIDRVGNAGLENAENVILDSVAPSVSVTAPSASYINDNTPLIRVTLSDATLGIENTAFDNTNNKTSGYSVFLRRDGDNLVLATLTPKTVIPGPFNSAIFENQYDTVLADNKYNIWVIAGDNLDNAQTYRVFTIDTVAPAAPTSLVSSITAGTVATPTSTTSTFFALTGSAEANSTVKVYTTTDGGVTWTAVSGTVTASATGAWNVTVQLTEFAGESVAVAVTSTDAAGNESARATLGYFKYTPASPSSLAGSVSAGASPATASVTTNSTVAITGTASPNSTVKVYTTTDGGVTWDEYAAGETTASATGAWTTTVNLSGFAGDALGIAVTTTDAEGNESARALYGYLLFDPNAPSVSLTAPVSGTTTDQSSVEVTGSVTKDAWESYTDIVLTLQVGTGSVTVPIASDGTFVYSVALSEGLNTVLVRASDGVNAGAPVSVAVTRTVTPWATYAIIVVIVALILAAIAIFRRR